MASRRISDHLASKNRLKRSLSDTGLSSNGRGGWGFIPKRHITGHKVKRALKAKSQRYRRGHFRPRNRPKTPAATPCIPKRLSCSLSDIISLISLEDLTSSDTISIDTLKPVHIVNEVKSRPRERQRFISSDSAASTISLATLKNSISEYSQHSGDPELEYDLYDCDLNNVSAAPGSLFNPTVFFDLTPTEEDDEELELTELFPMLRCKDTAQPKRSHESKHMVDSLTSDLAASMTSEDLTEESDTLLKPVSNLTSLAYDVSYVDE